MNKFKIINFSDTKDKFFFDQLIAKKSNSFIQQSCWWADIVCPISGDTPIFICSEDEKMTASMYGYRGKFGDILVSNIQPGSLGTFTCLEQNPDKLKTMYSDMIRFLVDLAEQRKYISVTVTDNPMNRGERACIETFFQPDASMETFIQAIELKTYFDQNGEVCLPAYKKRSCLSRNIKKALKQKFVFSMENDPEELLNWYHNIHCQRIKTLKGMPLPIEIFQNIAPFLGEVGHLLDSRLAGVAFLLAENTHLYHRFLGEGKAFFFKVINDQKMLAGALCICKEKGIMDNYIMAASDEGIKQGVNYYLIDKILKWCFSNHMTFFNWQSSNPPDGGIFRFKKHWGSKVFPYSFFCKILDKKKFRRLQQYPLNEIQSAYKGHFIAPYPLLTNDRSGHFTKKEINDLTQPI